MGFDSALRTPHSALAAASRRDLFRLSAAGFAGACAAPWFHVLSARAAETTPAKPMSCILLWMIGGPPQSLTFDVKTHSAVKAIQTAAPGVRFSEHFPKLAKEAKSLSLLRGMRTSESNHATARYLMHSGFRKGQNAVAHPVLGSVVAKDLGDPHAELPAFVSVGSPQYPGFGPGHLGPRYAPVRVEVGANGLADVRPPGTLAEFDAKAGLLNELNAAFLADHVSPAVQSHQVTLERAAALMHTPKTKAFDLSAEPTSSQALYGASEFGKSCLLARRLVESGVRFVEVRHNGWDVHKDTVNRTKKLSEDVDGPFAGLLADLRQRGLLDRTLVIWMGEFGRNPANGSNHFSRAWTTVLAGGGLRHGQAVGDTGSSGGTVEKDAISVGDFMATVCRALGVNYAAEWTSSTGRPLAKVAKGAEPVKALFG